MIFFFLEKKGKYYQLLTIKQIRRIIHRSRLKKFPTQRFHRRVAFYKLFVDGAKRRMKWDGFFWKKHLCEGIGPLLMGSFTHSVITWLEIKEGVIMWSPKEHVHYLLSRAGWTDLGNTEEVASAGRNATSPPNTEEVTQLASWFVKKK